MQDTDNFYPDLPPGAVFALGIIHQKSLEDPEYLASGPYSPEDLEVLQRFVVPVEVDAEAGGEDLEDIGGADRLERESNKLFKSLIEAQSTFRNGDAAQQMAYFRTATSLLDKIVGIQERTANLKQIHKFHNTVLAVMEDVLDAGQRTEVTDRLKEAITNAD